MAKISARGAYKVASVSFTTEDRHTDSYGNSHESYVTFTLRSDGAVLRKNTDVTRYKSDGGKYPYRSVGNNKIIGKLRDGLPMTGETLRKLRIVKAYANKYTER